MPNERYQSRLRRTHGFKNDEPIYLVEMLLGGLGVWDTVENRFVKLDERGEWIPDDSY